MIAPVPAVGLATAFVVPDASVIVVALAVELSSVTVPVVVNNDRS